MFYFVVPVVSTLFFAMLVGTAWVSVQPGASPQAETQPAQIEPAARPAHRCRPCGTIMSKREVPRDAADPDKTQIYEYSLRMPDGSSNVFQEAMLVSWRLGERVMVIDGTTSDRKH